jgi:hypothetical protein
MAQEEHVRLQPDLRKESIVILNLFFLQISFVATPRDGLQR